MIQNLIDKTDNFEIVRDKIAQILADEVASQKALAIADSKDPLLWDLNIYIERNNPWEKWLNQNDDVAPIVNVWFENYNTDDGSTILSSQSVISSKYNIDIYGLGVSKNNSGGGHYAGDEESARAVQNAFKLVRNILMSSTYTYLDLRGTVSQRKILSVTAFQPEQQSGQTIQAQRVQAIRLVLDVRLIEYSPQYEGETLEYISNDIKRDSDGAIIAQADYQYPIN